MDVMEKRINREVLRAAVSHTIFCAITGRVLDVRTAVLITVTDANGKSAARCIHGDAFDRISEALTAECAKTGATLEIIDGRTL